MDSLNSLILVLVLIELLQCLESLDLPLMSQVRPVLKVKRVVGNQRSHNKARKIEGLILDLLIGNSVSRIFPSKQSSCLVVLLCYQNLLDRVLSEFLAELAYARRYLAAQRHGRC